MKAALLLTLPLLLCPALARAAGDDVPAPAPASSGDSAGSEGGEGDGSESGEGGEEGAPGSDGGGALDDPADLGPLTPGRDEFAGGRLSPDLSAPPTQGTLGHGVRPRRWLVLRPLLRFSAFYTDNVRRSDGNEDDDIELSTTLTLALRATRRSYTIDLGYTLVNRTFVDNDDLNALDQVLSGRLSLRFKRATAQLNARIGRLTRPEDPALQGGEARRWSSTAGLNISSQFSRYLGLLFESSFNYLDFQDRRSGPDQVGLGGSLFLTHPVPLGTLQFGGGYRELRYTGAERNNPDLGVMSVSLGYLFEWRRLSGQVRAGYEQAQIIERRLFPTNADVPDGLVASASLAWQLRRPTQLRLTASRQITLGSANVGAQTTTRATLAWVEQLTPTLRSTVSASFERQEPELIGDLDSIAVSGVLEWTPTVWLVVGGQASFQRVERDRGLEYDVLRLGISVSLRL